MVGLSLGGRCVPSFVQVDHTVLSDFKSTRSRDKHWLCSHERLVPAVSINSTERSSFIAKWVVLRVSFLFLHNRTWIPALSPWPSPLAQAAGPRPHEDTGNLTTPRWALSPASSSVSDPKLPPPTLPQGGCVSSVCGGGPLLPFHTVGMCVLCVCGGVPPTLPHCGCMYPLWWGLPHTLPHGGHVSSVWWGPPLPFHTVCVCVVGSPLPFHMVGMCVVGSPRLFHMVGVYPLCVVGSPLHFHTVGLYLLCVWWGPCGPSTQWACVFSVYGGVPLGKQKTGNVYLKHVEKYSYTAMKSKYFENQITCGDGRNPTCRQIF